MSKTISKEIKKQIGIIYSPGFGAGWSTWGNPESALDQELARAIDSNFPADQIKAIAIKNWPGQYMGGLEDCKVEWVEEGTLFKIREYDGSESIELGYCEYIAARDCTPVVISVSLELTHIPAED